MDVLNFIILVLRPGNYYYLLLKFLGLFGLNLIFVNGFLKFGFLVF